MPFGWASYYRQLIFIPYIKVSKILRCFECLCTKHTVTYYSYWHGLQVDAAIVRIMKTRKVLSHTLLITELFQQVTLLPFGSLIQMESV